MATGKDMVGALGAEVDRLESEIKRVMPGIRHIDLVRCLRTPRLSCCNPNDDTAPGSGMLEVRIANSSGLDRLRRSVGLCCGAFCLQQSRKLDVLEVRLLASFTCICLARSS